MFPLALLGNFRASKESVKSFTDVLIGKTLIGKIVVPGYTLKMTPS